MYPKWKILGPFLTAPRDVEIDYLMDNGGEYTVIPNDDQVFHSSFQKMASCNGLKWCKEQKCKSNCPTQTGIAGKILRVRRSKNVCYAYAEVFPLMRLNRQ